MSPSYKARIGYYLTMGKIDPTKEENKAFIDLMYKCSNEESCKIWCPFEFSVVSLLETVRDDLNEKGLTSDLINLFQKIIYGYYKNHKRKFPFRENITPYNVLVSEIMLQQTQTARVSEKFLKFIEKFCNRTLWLHQGQILGFNDTEVVLEQYAKV